MKVTPLPGETVYRKRADLSVDIGYADFAGSSAGAVALTGFTSGINDLLELSHIELITPFNSADGAFVSSALTVGDAGSANRYLASTELNAQGAYQTIAAGTGTKFVNTTATPILFTFTPTATKNLANLTVGLVRAYFRRLTPDLTA